MTPKTRASDRTGQKRPLDEAGSADEKRPRTDQDDELNGLFEPLPFETKDSLTSLDFPADNAASGPTDVPGSTMPTTKKMSDLPLPAASSHNQYGSGNMHNIGGANPLTRATSTNMQNAQSTGGLMETSVSQNSAINQSASQTNFNAYPRQGTGYPLQYRSTNGGTASPGPAKTSTRFDPRKSYPMAYSASAQSVPQVNGAQTGPSDKDKAEDPSKLNDALAAAGVDIQREEELLFTNFSRGALNPYQQQLVNRQRQGYSQLNAFLHPYHVALAMNRTARDNRVMQNFMVDPEMLDLMSCACKEWLSNIVTKTVALANHRRRNIPAFNQKNKGSAKQKPHVASQRSEVSKELRNLALRQKELEERRVVKRALLGLEKSSDVAPETGNKAGADETLHRAANATAAMMTMNPKKKYSWMTSGSGSTAEDSASVGSKDSGAKQSALISARGDNGLRYREIRTGNMITSKDLLLVLETERMGTSKAVIKGYARLKD